MSREVCVITRKKLNKLRRDPKAFFLDSRFNVFGKLQQKQASGKVTKHIENNSKAKNQSKKVNEKAKVAIMSSNNQCALKPINKFDFMYVVQGLENYGVIGVYIKPFESNLKWALCILKSEKLDFLQKFLAFIYDEGLGIAYKTAEKIKSPKNINEIFVDFERINNIDIRLTTDRNLGSHPERLWFRLEFVNNNEDDFILFPTANQISRKLWKHSLQNSQLFKSGIQSYQDLLNYPHEQEHAFDIDLVFTWVNSDDPDWQKMYSQYKPDFNSDATSTSRFLSRDELKYALRSWDKYGSFIRNIYIVSNCAPPEWLDLSNSRISWVYHEEIMPREALPTFSSHAIETSLHNIQGLSNYFIYSNDDFLLVKPLEKNNFYYANGIAKLRLEPYGNVNGGVTFGEPDYLNAARNSNALLEGKFGRTTTQLHTHSPQSMRCDILRKMNEEFQVDFERTLLNKFRDMSDIAVTGYLYHHYALLSGNALQSGDRTELVQQNHDFVKKLRTIVELNKNLDYAKLPISVCINDGADSHLNERWNEEVNKFLENLFPEKSIFEK